MKSVLPLLAAVCAVLLPMHTVAKPNEEVAEVVKRLGHIPLTPQTAKAHPDRPASGRVWQPGYVFRVNRFANGTRAPVTVCYNLFVGDVGDAVEFGADDREGSTKGSVRLAASLLRAVGKLVGLDLGASVSWETHTVARFTGLSALSLADETSSAAMKAVPGKPLRYTSIRLRRECLDSLFDKFIDKKTREFTEPLYFIRSTVVANQVTVSYVSGNDASASANARIEDVVDLSAAGSRARTIAGAFQIDGTADSPILLGYLPEPLTKILQSGDVGGGDGPAAGTVQFASLSTETRVELEGLFYEPNVDSGE